jgi:hypothetical protein
MAIQSFLDNWEWVSQPGNPVAYASYLRKDPLPGVPAKSVLIQFAKGDQAIVNPTTTAFLRAGDLADRATYYRHDLAYPALPVASTSPHTYSILITSTNPTQKAIALATQKQIATFLASDGAQIIQPQPPTPLPPLPLEYFQVGMTEAELPEGLNFITTPAAALAGAAAELPGSPASGSIPEVAASDRPDGESLGWSPTATSGSTYAARSAPQAALAVPIPLGGPPATPAASLVDLALERLSPLDRLLRPARRRR